MERQFKCSMRLSVPGPDLYAIDVEGDMYAAIDLVTKKIEGQIRKRHSKYINRSIKMCQPFLGLDPTLPLLYSPTSISRDGASARTHSVSF